MFYCGRFSSKSLMRCSCDSTIRNNPRRAFGNFGGKLFQPFLILRQLRNAAFGVALLLGARGL